MRRGRVRFMQLTGNGRSASSQGREEGLVDLTRRQKGSVAVLDLRGKLTLTDGATDLKRTMGKMLDEGCRDILINLDWVPHVDSAGVGALVACHTMASEVEGRIKLLNPSRKVSDMLRITKLASVFELHRDEEEALRSFR